MIDRVRELAEIERFVAERGAKRLPRRHGTGPAIAGLRPALMRGEVVTVKRGRGKRRKIVFNPAPEVVERICQDEAEARRRRRKPVGTRNKRL